MGLHLIGSDCEDVWEVLYVCSALDQVDDMLGIDGKMLGRKIWGDCVGRLQELWPIGAMEREEIWMLCHAGFPYSVYFRSYFFFRTHMGRARAWLRLALMQKKLADYLKILIDHKDDLLSEYFEPDALMMSDEAIVIMGLLVGLNVVDCNLCVKVSGIIFALNVIYIRQCLLLFCYCDAPMETWQEYKFGQLSFLVRVYIVPCKKNYTNSKF